MNDYLILLTSDDGEDETDQRNNNINYNNAKEDLFSVSGTDELLTWTREHIALLSTTPTTLLVQTQAMADRLLGAIEALNEERKQKDENKMSFIPWKLDVEVLLKQDNGVDGDDATSCAAQDIWDLVLVSKILSLCTPDRTQSVVGIFFFPGKRPHLRMSTKYALDNLLRVCEYSRPSIPLALNRATASLCVKSLLCTRVAYVIFNPVAGQRSAQEDIATMKQVLEPCMRLKICHTKKDQSIAEQATKIVELIQQQQLQQQQKLIQSTSSSKTATSSFLPDYKCIIIASGGDGTVSAIAGATLNSGIPVGIIPRGTANAFSVALGIPTDSVEAACQLILRGTVREVDGALLSAELLWHSSLLEEEEDFVELHEDNNNVHQGKEYISKKGNNLQGGANGSHPHLPYFPKMSRWINHAGLGFEAGLVDNATRELKDKFGNLAYTIGAAQQIFRDEQFRCTFVVDGDESTEKTVETNVITIANVDAPSSIFAQGFGKVLPDDGLFEVTIGTATGFDGIRELATLMANAIVKDNVGSDTLLCFRCKQIKVTCDPPQKLLVDGEVIRDMDTVTFTCIHNGLKVIAPPYLSM
jgi:diacylglycerol kinase (ATP)